MSSRSGDGRQAVLIVGMHRSGTSAVTRVLNLLGVALPANLVGSFAGNELGHWEPAELPALHDRMLREAGTNVNGVLGIDRGWFASAAAAAAADAVAEYVSSAFTDAPLFALKDPRMALFVPVWRRALHQLGIAPRFVLPFRPPVEVAASLTKRQLAVFSDSVWPPARGELVWLNYVLSAERDTRDAPRSFVRFESLLENWRGETARMASQLGLTWPRSAEAAAAEVEAYLSHEHKHENSVEPATTALGRRVMDLLNASVQAPQGSAEAFGAAERDLEAARALFGDYVSALESALGALPVMNTEFGDFPSPLEFFRTPGPEADVAAVRQALERSRALLLGAASERRAQAAQIRQLQTLNAALGRSGGDGAGPVPAGGEHLGQERDRWREDAERLRASQGPLTLKLGALRTQLEEQEIRLRDLTLAKEASERRSAKLFAELEHARRDLDALTRSTSWRITAPVRRLRGWLSPPRAGAS